MAPARKKRENQFFDVGNEGRFVYTPTLRLGLTFRRKTGLTLPELPRDSHGFENIDGLFSSPAKSVQRSPRKDANSAQLLR
jgi:hypothetical protein